MYFSTFVNVPIEASNLSSTADVPMCVASTACEPLPSPRSGLPKSNKSKHVPKAQSRGMSQNDLRVCLAALKKIKHHKHAKLFLEPVDPVRHHAP